MTGPPDAFRTGHPPADAADSLANFSLARLLHIFPSRWRKARAKRRAVRVIEQTSSSGNNQKQGRNETCLESAGNRCMCPIGIDWQNEMDRLLERFAGDLRADSLTQAAYPALNLWEDSDKLFVEAELPGFELDELEIFVNGGKQLTIKGTAYSR